MDLVIKLALSLIISLVIGLIIMPRLIPLLHKLKYGQTIRKEGPQSHMHKSGTPTMGGIEFIIAPLVAVLIINPSCFTNIDFLIVALAFVGYALIGFIDDFIIVVKKDNEGLKPRYKLLLQSALALIFFFVYHDVAPTTVTLPFTTISINLGWLYGVLVFIMFTAETNAVNFADGLDGLCAGLVSLALIPFIVFSLVQQNYDLAIFLVALLGGLIAYLKYNMFPAKIMMGDTGSLALGGVLAASAMVLKQEIALVIIGGVFVMEILSVVIQVGYFKITKGKRFFKMAPIHHHFELSGYSEKQVVRMFWAAGFVLSVIGILMGVTL